MTRLGTLLTTGAVLCATAVPGIARASVLLNGWNYAIDSQTDGSPSSNGVYEYRGLAFKWDNHKMYVAISSQMPLGGNAAGGALNGRVNHGDLFFNWGAGNLTSAAAFNNPLVFGIRFDPLNDSFGNVSGSNTTTGVFGSISVTSLTNANTGWSTLTDYVNGGWGRTVDAMADLENNIAVGGDVRTYLGGGTQYPNMLSGTKLGDITMLNKTQLTSMGLNFGAFGADPAGNNVWGFSWDRSLMPNGNVTMHIFEECINDGMALKASVPEPGSAALVAGGAFGFAVLLRRRRKQ
jgi:hypothetical protein